ncbi:MAG: hypothetical protein OXE02_07045 [Chloroflexi bacterium]|nr:hypothetical protein [Chloroflexota bacterium]
MRIARKALGTAALSALLLTAALLLAACGSDDPGLTRAEVEEIVRAELAAESSASVEGTVNDTPDAAAVPPATAGLTRADVEEIVRAAIAGIPPRAAPAEYTQYVVDSAVARYESQGLDAALAHYNSAQSIDGQWYVFIIDENDLVIAHPDPERRGLDLKGWVGTDANGYEFGPDMLAATEEGKWVSYVYSNPENSGFGTGFGDVELKNVWVVKHDGMLFASGWYIDADEFAKQLVSEAVDNYRDLGLAGTMSYFASPGSVLAGLETTVAYYNAAETVDGQWFAFIGGPDGTIVGHSDPPLIGGDVQDLFGDADFDAAHLTADGEWVESETLRVYVAGYDGHVFGTGWSQDE